MRDATKPFALLHPTHGAVLSNTLPVVQGASDRSCNQNLQSYKQEKRSPGILSTILLYCSSTKPNVTPIGFVSWARAPVGLAKAYAHGLTATQFLEGCTGILRKIVPSVHA